MADELNSEKMETVPTAQNNESAGAAVAEEESGKTEEKVIIHTMPKRFFRSAVGSEKSKNVGVIIMVLGVLVLIAIAGFSYYFFLRPDSQPISSVGIEKIQTATTTEETDKKPVKASSTDQLQEATTSPVVTEATTTNEELPVNEGHPSMDQNVGDMTGQTDQGQDNSGTASSSKREIIQVPDTDKDGLTDTEEAMLGTIANLRDSDGDGYDDYSEYLGLYNPAGAGSLITNDNIEKYTNSKNGYSLYYPKKMTVENVGGSEDSVIFSFFDGQMIQIVAEPNTEKLSLDDWYKKQFGVSTISDSQRLYKKGWTGLRSDDGLTVYLTNPVSDKIFTLNYNISTDNKLSRKATFDMMVNSFSL